MISQLAMNRDGPSMPPMRTAEARLTLAVVAARNGELDRALVDDEARGWARVVERRCAARGEVVAVIAHGEHVADVVPSGELERLRETIEVLRDSDAMRDLADSEPVVSGIDAVRRLVADRARRERS